MFYVSIIIYVFFFQIDLLHNMLCVYCIRVYVQELIFMFEHYDVGKIIALKIFL